MQIKVLYFATLRDRAGVKEEIVELLNGDKVSDLKHHIRQLHPAIEGGLPSAVVAVNQEFAFDEEILSSGDEVAIFPPVSGGASDSVTICKVTEDAFDLNEVLTSLVEPTSGAACFFTGVVRAVTQRDDARKTSHLEYEAYQPMAESKLLQIAEEMRQRWPSLEGIMIVQRIGHLDAGKPTVLVACTAGHRDTGVFEAARYGIDRLKEIVPIWKKEVGPTGEFWIEGTYQPDKDDRRG
ncbi:MAG: molybdopterin converting factor subunit 1 [Chloroflexi bacterium]|nr:molybdopterin converting factor subunit 1 [Chloroflexota bacterium]